MKLKKVKCGLCSSSDSRKIYEVGAKTPFTVVKCNDCGFIYTNPIVEDIEGLYGEDYYNSTSGTGFGFTHPLEFHEETKLTHRARLSLIQKITGLKAGKLLDVGCTFGTFVLAAQKHGWDSYGCDLSKYAVAQAKKIGAKKVYAGTVKSADFKENFFDVVTLFEVIEHVEKPLQEMKQVNRLLKKGGTVVVQTGNLDSLTAKIRGNKNPYLQLGHISYFSKKTMKKLMNDAGFDVILLKTETEKSEHARIALGKATARDYWRLFYYGVMERCGLSGSMLCYARKR